ncbi:GFA family protein [Lysobacter enzymogenes]|uniref:GFA family protein n=1 Tax=Lysobacter enzymogenes TaxID=69 RepID=UPI000895465D|nr:GFA family protein [Lysobacter enzymogenes]SDW17496.1 Uncharacterized conserved protein [Lysobacter enzymogenes]
MSDTAPTRTAACACGQLRAHTYGEPRSVYACACLDCQRATGSAFSYRARYELAQLRIEGGARAWRRGSDAGRWVEQHFCPHCGTLVYMTAESLPDGAVVSAGCFADPEFAAPGRLYRASRKHGWFDPGAAIETVG